MQKEIFSSSMPDEVKGLLRETRMGDLKLTYDEQITNLVFWLYLI